MPNRSDVDRVERDLLRALRLPARRHDRHLRRPLPPASPRGDPEARAGRDRRAARAVARRAVAERVRAGTALVALGALRRVRRHAARDASASSSPGCSIPATSTATSPSSTPPTAPSSTGVGLWDRDLLRRRAAERLAADLDAWHGEPVFAYGFEDLTGAEWSLLEALAGRAEVDVSLPYEPGRVAFASLAAHGRGPRRARRRPHRRSSRRARPSTRRRRSPTSSATLFEERRRRRRAIGDGVRFLEGAGDARHARARRRRGARAAARRHPRRSRSRSSRRRSNAGARRSRRSSATLGIPYAVDGRVRLGATPLGHALLALLRFAWAGGGRARALRVPALAVLGHRALERRLRRGPAARPRDPHAGARRGGDRAAARGAARRRCASCAARGRRRSRACARCSRAMLRCGVRARRRRRPARRRGSTCAASPRRSRLLDELEAWERLGEPVGAERRDRGARAARGAARSTRRARARRGARPDARAHAALRGRVRARARGGVAAAARPQLAVPRRRPPPRARRAARAARSGQPRPLPLLHRLHARDAAAVPRPRGGDRRRRAARAEPVLGRGRGGLRPRRRRARDAAPRALAAHVADSTTAPTERERLRALARLAVDDARPARSALADANGWRAGCARARRAFDAADAPAQPGRRSQWLGERSDVRRHRARALRRLLVGVALRARGRPEDDRRRGRRDAARQGRPPGAATRSTTGLPKELGADRVTDREPRARRSGSSSAASTTRCAAACGSSSSERAGGRAARGAAGATSSGSCATRRARRSASCRAASRSASAPTARRPSCSAGSSSATASSSAARSTASTSTRTARAGSCRTTSRARAALSATQIDDERRLQVPLYMLVLRDLVGIEPLGGVYRALAGARGARGMLRAEARDDLPGFQRERLPRRGRVLGARRDGARARARGTRSGSARRRRATTRRAATCPSWCDLWTMCRVARP